jgi:hypothetical protein
MGCGHRLALTQPANHIGTSTGRFGAILVRTAARWHLDSNRLLHEDGHQEGVVVGYTRVGAKTLPAFVAGELRFGAGSECGGIPRSDGLLPARRTSNAPHHRIFTNSGASGIGRAILLNANYVNLISCRPFFSRVHHKTARFVPYRWLAPIVILNLAT